MKFTLDHLIAKLVKHDLDQNRFFDFLSLVDGFGIDKELEYELLLSNGLPLTKDDKVSLKTKNTAIKNEIWTFVDIETNGPKPQTNDIIEIAAIKVKNGKIIDKFQSLVYSKYLPYHITKLTSITKDMLLDAPSQEEVMRKFKLFLQDSIFVAHNVSFDYNFISKIFNRFNLGELNNRKLCTIDLAKKSFTFEKYGLKTLNKELNINITDLHRAYNDAYLSYQIFKNILTKIPSRVKTTENLICFSLHG